MEARLRQPNDRNVLFYIFIYGLTLLIVCFELNNKHISIYIPTLRAMYLNDRAMYIVVTHRENYTYFHKLLLSA